MKHFVVATAGHVDHGKSALVKALTGTDPDRLPEEKARQITIDLGFAELNLRGPGGEEIHAAIVDVPGHEDFVKNMIAGVGSIDLALLIVAADDGWMPQTEEHVQILHHLNVTRAVVSLTKSDLSGPSRPAGWIQEQLRETRFVNAPVVATSTITGAGLEELQRVIAAELAALSPQPDLGQPRLFVDRAFSLHGIGTVVTGSLTGGTLRREQAVVVQPANVPARIRRIQSHKREMEQAMPGTRVALNLSDVTVNTKKGVARGDVITIPDLGEAVRAFDAFLTRPMRGPMAELALKNGASIYLHHGTGRVGGRVTLAHGANEFGLVQVRVESRIHVLVGDRFVLRDPSERRTLAGGVVLDVATDRRKFRSARQGEFLRSRAQSPDDVMVALRCELRRDGARLRAGLLSRSKFTNAEIDAALTQLAAKGEILWQDEVVTDAEWWSAFRRDAMGEIAAHHEKFPQSSGLDLAQLRSRFSKVPDRIFDALINALGRDGYIKEGNLIRRSGHLASLPPELVEVAQKIREILSEKPLDPPARKQIAPDARSRQALAFLVAQGELIDLGPELVVSGKAFSEMQRAVINFLAENGSATVSELRQLLQTSRRVAVPFLERLDRERVTRRAGDRRALAGKL